MKYLIFPLLFLIFACQSEEPTATSNTAPTETSQPAPEVNPTAAIEGPIQVETFEDWSADLDGSCWCLLQPDPNETTGYCFAFSRDGLSAKMLLDGEMQLMRRGASLSPGGGDNYLSFLHDGQKYSVQTSINNEGGQEGNIDYSGQLTITRKSDGEETTVRVVGSCSC